MALRRTLLLALAMLVASVAPADAHWRWPVHGGVVARFRIGPDRFARGQHRGIDVAAPAGAAVRAACRGRVTFAGKVGVGGRTVSVRCGDLVATYQHLRAIFVGRGEELGPGARVGTIGATGRPLHFGVHRAADRHRYLDPLVLLGEDAAPAPPLPPVPLAPRGRRPNVAPPPPGPAPSPGPAPAKAGVPMVAWVGLGLACLGLPGWRIGRGRRRRYRPAAEATKTLASSASCSQSG